MCFDTFSPQSFILSMKNHIGIEKSDKFCHYDIFCHFGANLKDLGVTFFVTGWTSCGAGSVVCMASGPGKSRWTAMYAPKSSSINESCVIAIFA